MTNDCDINTMDHSTEQYGQERTHENDDDDVVDGTHDDDGTNIDDDDRSDDGEIRNKPPRDPRLKRIREQTELNIKKWTTGMIKTSFVEDISNHIDEGLNWITITGNAGDGKTTTAYMVLKEMTKRGKEVFHVTEIDQYYTVIENAINAVVMLDDVLGTFSFDPAALSKWEPVINYALGNMTKSRETGQTNNVTVIFVSRWNVLHRGRDMLKYGRDIVGKTSVVNVGDVHENVTGERLQILEYHLKRTNITTISKKEKQEVAAGISPHGFPHCCKLYADFQTNVVNIKEFFSRPLQFLNNTTNALIEKEEVNKVLFKQLLQNDGTMEFNSIQESLRPAANSLVGGYLSKHKGIITFSHPSVYESVALCIGTKAEEFAIKHFSFSFLLQTTKFLDTLTPDAENLLSDFICIHPTTSNIKRLSERFSVPLIDRKFDILQHGVLANEELCETLISSVTTHRRRHFSSCLLPMKRGKLHIDTTDKNGDTLLHVAARCGNLVAVRVLLKHGASGNKLDANGDNALRLLCKSLKTDKITIDALIRPGADVNRADDKGKTPLHYMCAHQQARGTIDLLVQLGARVTLSDDLGRTPLHYLCGNEKSDGRTIQLLMEHGAPINKSDSSGWTPLHYLCSNENVDVKTLKMLINRGADVNKVSNSGRTPLHFLCGNTKADGSQIEFLIKHGSDVNKPDILGRTSLHQLCENAKVVGSTVDILIKHGADINITDIDGCSPLFCLRDNELKKRLTRSKADETDSDDDEKKIEPDVNSSLVQTRL